MISSMQKNKKWLLPTIWISTIAFVGAGFVGWGSYNPSTSSSSVATVGSKEISMKDLNQEYSNLYSQYKQTFGEQFNEELASKLNLQKVAYDNVVQRFLLLNLSEDFGFTASDEEVFEQLAQIKSFFKNGKFDNNTYKTILKQNRTTPSAFEEEIRKNIIVSKIQNVFAQDTNQNTIKSLNELFFASDKAQINIIDSKDIQVSLDEDEIKKFYEKNKQNYKSIQKYKVNVQKVKIGEDEKASKKEALKAYLKLKKATLEFKNSELLDVDTQFLSKEEQDIIFNSTIGTVLKPIKVNGEFVIYQLIEKISPKVLPYENVKEVVTKEFKANKLNSILNSKKEELLKNFTGKDIGYITKGKLIDIDGLNKDEVNTLSSKISTATSLVDFVQLDGKIVVFKILDTKLATYDKTKDQYITDTIIKLKNNQALSSIIEKLRLKYKITTNFKVN